ncbi:hypothetical protein [Actinomadura sp. 6N118]|uniref:hypothetical protein n=1 Tax=Actinomadura sp. 6N118 TaxID=3375151 RepID=UPI003791950B
MTAPPESEPVSPRQRHARQIAKGAGKRATREIGRRAGKQVREQATKQFASKATQQTAVRAGQQLGKQAGKHAGKQVVAQAGKQAAIQGVKGGASAAGATASAGVTLAVQAGVEAGLWAAKKIGWRRIAKALVWLAAPVALGILFLIVTVAAILSSLAGAPGANGAAPATVPGIPPVALDAYNRAATVMPQRAPRCTGVTWYLLAALGKIESDHAQGRTIASNGDVKPPFTGPPLNGRGIGGNRTPHYDTDDGKLDSDSVYDRAVGPMQFLPGTWKTEGHDGNGDGRADPQNYYDAALSAAFKLCGGGDTDLADPSQLYRALRRYNNADWYARKVMDQAAAYARLSPTPSEPLIPGGGGRSKITGNTMTSTMRTTLISIDNAFGPFPVIGCFRPGDPQDHGVGRACDFMESTAGQMPSPQRLAHGDQVAAFATANAQRLGIKYVIWKQRIWNIHRAGEGWRPMGNRGSLTQNHFDHLHISVER